MTNDKYRAAIVIEGKGRNHVESIVNQVRKHVDQGRVEYGLDLEMRRVDLDKTDIEGFDNE